MLHLKPDMEPDEADCQLAETKEDEQLADHQQPAGSTLLPAPIANTISLVTRSSSLYLRLGSFLGGLALDGARVTTLTGLELSRAVIESILYRAGKDVSARSTGELGKAEAEGALERSIATLHSTITNISFAASTGFYISAAALESATDISQQLLATLDSILGSTDSSRAIASIITLIRREFQNPATGQEGEKIGVADLLMGICGLALLQRWCKKLTDAESRERKYEEVVWDVVVLDNGRRVDVVGVDNAETGLIQADPGSPISFITSGGDEVVETIEREGLRDDSDEDMPEINLKQRIIRSLPGNASVSITTSTETTKTITVEITGTELPDISPPPGVEMIEEDTGDTNSGQSHSDGQELTLQSPKYRVVYRIFKNKLRGTNIQASEAIANAAHKDDMVDASNSIQRLTRPDLPVSPILSPNADQPPELPTRPSASPAIPTQNENTANQKRSRKPMSSASSVSGSEKPPPQKLSNVKSPAAKKVKSDKPSSKPTDKKGTFRNALKKGSGTGLSNLWGKESEAASESKPQRPPWGVPTPPPKDIPQRKSSIIPAREAPRAPQRGNPIYFSSRDLGLTPENIPRSPSRASYYSIHERRRDSMVSQTDTYSIHSTDGRPPSPAAFRTHLRAQSSLIRARSEKNISNQPPSPSKNHRRSKSFVPSIYTLGTNNSATSLVLAPARRSAFQDSKTLETLMRTGYVDGLFPQHHIVRNITRFVRFASASYGASFLRFMGIATSTTNGTTKEIDTNHHHEHHSFSNHTQLPTDTILLSSFVDPQGGTDSTGHTGTGIPMVHFVSLDHDSKAVVLTCRGTLGFEDVLTDMTCDYDELTYRGKAYRVHMGIHASARRLLSSRVLVTIKAALEEFPDYGLVLCGHSLGGGVTTLLAIMISEPSLSGSSFVTSTSESYDQPQLLLTASQGEKGTAPDEQLHLPPGRPIHVYAYGPPATLSPSLRLATRGLITTIVNGQDLVPYLSLGTLHDLQAVALAFKNDDSGAKGEVRKRVWEGLRGTLQDKWYQNGIGGATQKEEDDQWAYSALKALRASMLSSKLVPPGEVFVVESMPVLRRDAFTKDGGGSPSGGIDLGRPATRSILRYVRDVEKRFGEIQFGGSMLLDHSPGRYEASLGALGRGILGG